MLRPGSLAASLRDLRQVVAMPWAPVFFFFVVVVLLLFNGEHDE